MCRIGSIPLHFVTCRHETLCMPFSSILWRSLIPGSAVDMRLGYHCKGAATLLGLGHIVNDEHKVRDQAVLCLDCPAPVPVCCKPATFLMGTKFQDCWAETELPIFVSSLPESLWLVAYHYPHFGPKLHRPCEQRTVRGCRGAAPRVGPHNGAAGGFAPERYRTLAGRHRAQRRDRPATSSASRM